MTLPDGQTITVTVAEIRPWDGNVRLGTSAPRNVRIDRQEVHDANRAARLRWDAGHASLGPPAMEVPPQDGAA